LLILAARLGLVTQQDLEQILQQASSVGRMLNGLKRSLRSKL